MTTILGLGAAAFALNRPGEASTRLPHHVVTAGALCVTSGGEDCLLVAAATLDARGDAAGAFLVDVPAVDRRLVLSPRQGHVETLGTGWTVTIRGPAQLVPISGRAPSAAQEHPDFFWLPRRLTNAVLSIDSSGAFSILSADISFTGRTSIGGVQIHPSTAAGRHDIGVHEVGHWLGVIPSFDNTQPPMLAMGLVVTDGELDGLPDVAGLFRDTADGETGHIHGQLQAVTTFRQRGTSRLGPLSGFEATGDATCVFDVGAGTPTALTVAVDLADGILLLGAPGCRFAEMLAIERLSCPGGCSNTVIVGSGWSQAGHRRRADLCDLFLSIDLPQPADQWVPNCTHLVHQPSL